MEVSVRRTCFFPARNHVNYITVRGFEMAQATGDWAPPTSQQVGHDRPELVVWLDHRRQRAA